MCKVLLKTFSARADLVDSWSDGLGNPEGDGLPTCQLKRLARFLQALPTYPEIAETDGTLQRFDTIEPDKGSNCYFWMDTLCIPVKNQHLRDQAIVRMRDIYKLASNVLVLSAELMQSSCKRPYTEICTRISCCAWLRRLWTLQEATLNRNVLFQFSEQAVYVGSRSASYEAQAHDNKNSPWDLVAWECRRYTFNLLDVFPYFSNSARINTIWDCLSHRTTSRIGDAPLVIAILLDLDIDKFLKDPDARTIKKFWSLHVNSLPATVLFLPGPKLPDEGFGWALANLMNLRIMGSDIDLHATFTPRGLCVSFSGFILQQLGHPVHGVIACVVDGTTFFIRQSLLEENPSWEGLNLHTYPSLAVILMVLTGVEEKDASGIDAALGVIVDVRHSSDPDELYVKYLRFVSITSKGSFSTLHPNVPWSSTEIEEKKRVPVAGVYLSKEQKWCVA